MALQASEIAGTPALLETASVAAALAVVVQMLTGPPLWGVL